MAVTLGLGVVFESLDKGLKKDLKEINKGLKEAKKNVSDLKSAQSASSKEQIDFQKKLLRAQGHIVNNTKKTAQAIKSYASVQSEAARETDKLNKTKEEQIKKAKTLSEHFDGLKKKLSELNKEGKKNSLQLIGKNTQDFGKSVINLGDSIQNVLTGKIISLLQDLRKVSLGSGQFNDLAKNLDTLSTKMSRVYDPNTITKFNAEVQKGMSNFGVTADQASVAAKSLTQFGLTSQQLLQSMPEVAKLVGGLGLDAEQVANMFGKSIAMIEATPKEVMSLTAQVNKLGTSFGFIDILEDLPDIMEQSTKNALKFGKANKQTVMSSTQSIASLAGAFKTMGVNQREAISLATSFADKASDMSIQLERMALGLDFDKGVLDFAAEVSRVTGQSYQSVIDQLQQGALNPDELRKFLTQSVQSATSQFDARRLTMMIGEKFGPEMQNIVSGMAGRVSEAGKQAEKNQQALGDANSLMDKQINQNLTSIQKTEDLIKANDELRSAIITLANKFDIAALGGARVRAQQRNIESLQSGGLIMDLARMADLTGQFGLGGVTAYKIGGVKNAEKMFGIGEQATNLLGMREGFDQIGTATGLVTNIVGGGIIGIGKLISLLGDFANAIRGIITLIGGTAGLISVFSKMGSTLSAIGKAALTIAGPLAMKLGGILGVGFLTYKGLNKLADIGPEFEGIFGDKVSLKGKASDFMVNLYRKFTGQMTAEEMNAAELKNIEEQKRLQAEIDKKYTKEQQQNYLADALASDVLYSKNINSSMYSDGGRSLIKKHEGLRLKAYDDGAGNKTIGYGHLIRKGENIPDKITKEQAEALFEKDFQEAQSLVQKMLKVPVTQEQMASLTSMAFNMGPKVKPIIDRINQGKIQEAGEAIKLYTKAKDQKTGEYKTLRGFVARRAEEAAPFLNQTSSIFSDLMPSSIASILPEGITEKASNLLSQLTPSLPILSPEVITSLFQPGAPAQASLGQSAQPVFSSADVSAITAKLDKMVEEISRLAAQQVTIQITGDIKRFLNFVMLESNKAVIASGHGQALNPS